MSTLKQILSEYNVLIIDDLMEARSSFKKMMLTLGAQDIDVAIDANNANELLKSKQYDLILSDYCLGKGKDGQQILEEGRFTRSISATCSFIMVTGENARTMVMGAIEYLPDAYITKPFNLVTLKNRLSRVLKQKKEMHNVYLAMDRQNYAGAFEECENLILQNTTYKSCCLQIMGQILISQAEYEKACQVYHSAIELNDTPWAQLGLAICHYHSNDFEAAAELLNKLIQTHPNYIQSYDWLAKIHREQGDASTAQHFLKRATAISPKAILRQTELGSLAMKNEDWCTASQAFKEATKLGKKSCYRSVHNYFNYAKSLTQQLDPDNKTANHKINLEIRRTIEEVKETYSNNLEYITEAYLIEQDAWNQQKEQRNSLTAFEKAETTFEKIESPKDPELQIKMAQAYASIKNWDKSQQLLEEIDSTRLHPELKILFDNIQDMNQEAQQLQQRAYSTEMNDHAIFLYEKGRYKEAIDHFLDALSYKEAGMSVLLNTIQSILTYQEKTHFNAELMEQCSQIFERIGDIDQQDSRFSRYQKLKNNYSQIMASQR